MKRGFLAILCIQLCVATDLQEASGIPEVVFQPLEGAEDVTLTAEEVKDLPAFVEVTEITPEGEEIAELIPLKTYLEEESYKVDEEEIERVMSEERNSPALQSIKDEQDILVTKDNLLPVFKTILLAFTHKENPSYKDILRAGGVSAFKTLMKYWGQDEINKFVLTKAKQYFKTLRDEAGQNHPLGEMAEKYLRKHRFKFFLPESTVLHQEEMKEFLENKKMGRTGKQLFSGSLFEIVIPRQDGGLTTLLTIGPLEALIAAAGLIATPFIFSSFGFGATARSDDELEEELDYIESTVKQPQGQIYRYPQAYYPQTRRVQDGTPYEQQLVRHNSNKIIGMTPPPFDKHFYRYTKNATHIPQQLVAQSVPQPAVASPPQALRAIPQPLPLQQQQIIPEYRFPNGLVPPALQELPPRIQYQTRPNTFSAVPLSADGSQPRNGSHFLVTHINERNQLVYGGIGSPRPIYVPTTQRGFKPLVLDNPTAEQLVAESKHEFVPPKNKSLLEVPKETPQPALPAKPLPAKEKVVFRPAYTPAKKPTKQDSTKISKVTSGVFKTSLNPTPPAATTPRSAVYIRKATPQSIRVVTSTSVVTSAPNALHISADKTARIGQEDEVAPSLQAVDNQQENENDRETVPVYALDPFYGGKLSRIDAIFQQFQHEALDNEECREQLVCNMYKNPDAFMPLSDFLSRQLTVTINELQKPKVLDKRILRFFRYLQAARTGQDGNDCKAKYSECKEDTTSLYHSPIADAFNRITRLMNGGGSR